MSLAIASDGVRLHYDVFGRRDGEPVLMIQGLGADERGWTLQRRAIGRDHRGIVFDNRGVGRSDKPVGQYSLEQMAEAGWEQRPSELRTLIDGHLQAESAAVPVVAQRFMTFDHANVQVALTADVMV